MLERIKRILSLPLEPSDDDFLLEQFVEMYTQALKLEIDENTIPVELEFILIETVVTRWNRRGSEGLKSESVDVVSHTFHDDVFAANRLFIEAYKANKALSIPKKGFRML